MFEATNDRKATDITDPERVITNATTTITKFGANKARRVPTAARIIPDADSMRSLFAKCHVLSSWRVVNGTMTKNSRGTTIALR
jgi:hypothetical protein